jgi:hypothetical protein
MDAHTICRDVDHDVVQRQAKRSSNFRRDRSVSDFNRVSGVLGTGTPRNEGGSIGGASIRVEISDFGIRISDFV